MLFYYSGPFPSCLPAAALLALYTHSACPRLMLCWSWGMSTRTRALRTGRRARRYCTTLTGRVGRSTPPNSRPGDSIASGRSGRTSSSSQAGSRWGTGPSGRICCGEAYRRRPATHGCGTTRRSSRALSRRSKETIATLFSCLWECLDGGASV